VNTTNCTPNISYTNGEKKKESQGKNKEIGKKEKNFAILLREAKTTALQEQTKWQLLLMSLSGDRDS
jgi:hypothetical protein